MGLAVQILGIASFVVPIPHNEREGFKAGGLRRCRNPTSDKLSPLVSAVMILGGAGMMIGGKGKG